MAAIVAAAGVIAGLDAVPATGQAIVGLKIAARNAADVARFEMPAHPVGNTVVTVIRQRVLRTLNQVVGRIRRAAGRSAGIAERELHRRIGVGGAR
jgi:hypothetical protein